MSISLTDVESRVTVLEENTALSSGIPDFSSAINLTPTTGTKTYDVTEPGFIHFQLFGNQWNFGEININGVRIAGTGTNVPQYVNCVTGLFPVVTGDKITFRSGWSTQTESPICKFLKFRAKIL